MKALALLLVALLLAPSVAATREPLPYAPALAAVSAKVVERVAPLENESAGKPWWPDASVWLDRARADRDAGRFHATLYDAETLVQIVRAHQLQDATNLTAATVGDQRAFVKQRALAWRAESNDTWLAFRARLHETDGAIRSVQALEMALYAADLGAAAKAGDNGFEALLDRFSHEPAIPFDYDLVFARMTQSVQLDVQAAGDALDAGLALDGVPPLVLADRWANTTRAAMADPGEVHPALQPYEVLARPARAGNETTLAVALLELEEAAQRFTEMSTIYGDAKGRVSTVFPDADRSFQKQLNNTTVSGVQSRGLAGVFTQDAVDKALYTQAVVDNGTQDLGIVLTAWSGLDHAAYANVVLADASPVKPAAAASKTPGPELALVVAAVALLAIAARWRRP